MLMQHGPGHTAAQATSQGTTCRVFDERGCDAILWSRYHDTADCNKLCWCRLVEKEQQRRQLVKEQHARSLKRGQEAAHADRLKAQARQTEAQLAAADQAQRARRAQALHTVQPAQLGTRYNVQELLQSSSCAACCHALATFQHCACF